MEICIRENYIDKTCLTRTHIVVDEDGKEHEELMYRREDLVKPPYNYKIVEIDDKYADCVASDFNQDLSFSIDKYKSRKETEAKIDYETKIVSLIRKKYSINQELAILRQRDTKPTEFEEYNEYVEQCKRQVKLSL
jgi:hypothetical protein